MIRTGCPSLWSLTAQRCKKSLKKKGKEVLVVLEEKKRLQGRRQQNVEYVKGRVRNSVYLDQR